MILLKSNTFDEGFNMAGTYQAIPFMVGLTGIDENMGIPVETSRRQLLGWYAQTTEIK
jgi:hypothetical protein